jgi:hypothetical protein
VYRYPFQTTLCPGSCSTQANPVLAVKPDLSKFSHNQARLAARIALLAAGTAVTAGARDAHSTLPVSATVRAVARMSTASAPLLLTVSGQDVARGFVEVREPTQVSIVSNSAQGYALEFQTLAPLFSTLTVHGLDSALSLGAEGGTVVQRWQHPQPVTLTLTYRFALLPGMTAGAYPWPLRLDVRPLEAL